MSITTPSFLSECCYVPGHGWVSYHYGQNRGTDDGTPSEPSELSGPVGIDAATLQWYAERDALANMDESALRVKVVDFRWPLTRGSDREDEEGEDEDKDEEAAGDEGEEGKCYIICQWT